MEVGNIGDNERVQILLTEYSSLRAEIDARFSRIYQLIAIGATVGLWLWQPPDGIDIAAKYLKGAAIVAAIVLLVLMADLFRGVDRIEKIEDQICGADKTLLNWKADRWSGRIILKILKVGHRVYRKLFGSN